MFARMKPHGKRIFFTWLIVVGGAALLIWISTLLLTAYLEDQISERINSANGKVSSVRVNLLSRSVKIKTLVWSSVPDSIHAIPHTLRLNTLSITGISLYQLLVNKTIRIREILLDSGKFQYNSSIKQIQQAVASKYTSFECRSISVNNIETQIVTDTVISFSARFTFHLTSARVNLDSIYSIRYSVKAYNGLVSNISLSRHEGMYGGTIRQFYFNTQEQRIVIDSVLLIPNFTKYKFAQYLGEQAGRVNISIPKLTLEGVAFDRFFDSTFMASKVIIQSFDLFSFKDKRLPFLRDYNIPLPMQGFLDASWMVKIDSILIGNSRITIEEFPAKGNELTKIVFNDVNATLTGLNNRRSESDSPYAELKANGLLMGSGKIQATFQLPLDGKALYTARGTVSDFPLATLNPVFVPIANIRIESGHLNKLTFDFSYTEFVSKGKLDIDYRDLHLLGLKKNSAETNALKSFVINILVKRDRDQSGKDAKAVGIIDIERDRRRLIFNIWWKSILNGLQSSMTGRSKPTPNAKK